MTGIVLKYRIPNNREGAYQDLQRAMRLARAHAVDWGIQPDKLGVIGFSAGGHLAARLSTHFSQAAYPEIDASDKLSCRPDFAILGYPAFLEVNGTLAPEVHVASDTPKTLMFMAEDDAKHVLSAKVYDAALTTAKIPHEFDLYPTGGHGFGLHSDRAAKVWPDQAAAWLHHIGI